MTSAHFTLASQQLPPDDAQRTRLHNEVHVRPLVAITAPALVVYIAVVNDGISCADECDHLRALPGQAALELGQLKDNFLHLQFQGYSLKWERHTEFTRYSIVQPLPEAIGSDQVAAIATPAEWLSKIPGHTIAAIEMVIATCDDATFRDHAAAQDAASAWFKTQTIVASSLERSAHTLVFTDFALQTNGFERIVVLVPSTTTALQIGRASARLLELETYRMMALQALPTTKLLSPLLTHSENALSEIAAQLENKNATDQSLLDALISLAAVIERATSTHAFRFAATRAYSALVTQRLAELREQPVVGAQTMAEFMSRRLSPAIATVEATAQRLSSLSDRVTRTSALLRTRVDIATEQQNQLLLEKLTRGQALQLRLQSTVEGLSIAAISYYIVSLLFYAAKAVKAAGAPINPEFATGALIPLVLFVVWWTVRRIHNSLKKNQSTTEE